MKESEKLSLNWKNYWWGRYVKWRITVKNPCRFEQYLKTVDDQYKV